MSESKIERATRIKARMAEHRLTAQWLMLRLSVDCDIQIDQSTLSQILSGTRCGGERPTQILDSAEKVLDKYEAAYSA